MPKFNILLNAGQALPAGIQKYLKSVFSSKDLDKLSKFGGRVQISITAPFINKKEQNRKLEITDDLIADLKINFQNAEEKLKPLTQKQLIEIAKRLNYPVRSSANSNELRNNLSSFLKSADRMKQISQGT